MIAICPDCGEVRNADVPFEDPTLDFGLCGNCGASRPQPYSRAAYVVAKPKGYFRKTWVTREGNQVA